MTFKTLVFSGGGLRGFAYIGCLKALEETKIIKDIDTFAGCSIGGVFAAMIAAGYTSEELYDFVLNFTYNDVRDIKVLNFFSSYGIETGDKMYEFIRIMLKRKTNYNNITFKEFYKLTNKKIIVNATCINEHRAVYFDHESYPDLSVALALRMTISLPFLIAPVTWNGKLYADGGIIDNFPIHLFNNREEVLGFKLTNDHQPCSEIPNFESYIRNTWSCIYGELTRMKLDKVKDYNLIKIPVTCVHTFNLYLTKEQRIMIYQTGYQYTKDHLEKLKLQPPSSEQIENQSNLVQNILADIPVSQLIEQDYLTDKIKLIPSFVKNMVNTATNKIRQDKQELSNDVEESDQVNISKIENSICPVTDIDSTDIDSSDVVVNHTIDSISITDNVDNTFDIDKKNYSN